MAKSGNTYIHKKVAKTNDLQNKAFLYRLKPTLDQEILLNSFTNNTNMIWDHFLKINKSMIIPHRRWAQRLMVKSTLLSKSLQLNDPSYRIRYNYFDMSKMLTELKQEDKYNFLYDSSSESLQQRLKDLHKALSEACDPKNDKEFPKFKSNNKNRSFRSVTIPKIEEDKIYVPRIGWITFVKSREIEGNPKFITVNKRGLHWFVSITTEGMFTRKKHPSRKKIGISRLGLDMMPKSYITLSNGTNITAPDPYIKLQPKLAKLNSKLSGKEKGSSNWMKQKNKITKLHTRIANIREDFIHKLTTDLSNKYKYIYVDKLDLKKLSKKSRKKGKNEYNKSILDKAWYKFTSQLKYKQEWNNGIFKEVELNDIKPPKSEVGLAKKLLSVGCSD